VSTSDFHPSVRTVLASFLFVDIVGFSKVPAARQHAFKAGLITVLHRHLSALHRGDYRLRDTGDGALISFLNNPEHALYLALAIAEDLGQVAEGADISLGDLRTGINLGAVKESIDVEQRPNYVGDGINAAQRIMDFAQPGQITASRSFMEAVAHLDAGYAALFQHLGARADKHGREHELFSLAPSADVLERLRDDIIASRPPQIEVDFDLDLLAPPTLLPGPANVQVPWFRRQWVLGVTALVLTAGFSVLMARWFDGREAPLPAAAAPAENKAPRLAEPAASPSSATPSMPSDANAGAASPAPVQAAASAPPAESTPVTAPTLPPPPAERKAAAAQAPASPTSAPTPAPREANAAARTARKPVESPRQLPPAQVAESPPAPTPAISAQASLRCSRIMQKAGVGEPLTAEEKKELANSCR
jgi:class 3 adenylate cyclase